MAFNSAEGRAVYVIGSGQTDFTFVFKAYKDSDLKVYYATADGEPYTLLTLTTDYSVSINGDDGGTVIISASILQNGLISLVRSLPITREVDYHHGGDVPAATLNEDQEYQTYLIADKQAEQDDMKLYVDEIDTALGAEIDDVREKSYHNDPDHLDASTVMPPYIANKYIKWDNAEKKFVNGDPDGSLTLEGTIAVDTIASMMALDPNDVTTVIVVEDGRGGIFNYDASKIAINDGGTIFLGWVRQYNDEVFSEWFEAKGDGVTNDYNAIVAAMALGKKTRLKKTIYDIGSNTLTITDQLIGDGGHLYGSDSSFSGIHSSSTGFAVILKDGALLQDIDVHAAMNGVAVYGIKSSIVRGHIFSTNIAAVGSIGLQLGDGTLTNPAYYNRIEPYRIRKFKQGVVLLKYANANYVKTHIVNTGAADGDIDNYVLMYGGNANTLEVAMESAVTTTGHPIEFRDDVGCSGNRIRVYWEFVSNTTESVLFPNTSNTYGNTVVVLNRGGYNLPTYAGGAGASNICTVESNRIHVTRSWQEGSTVNLFKNWNFQEYVGNNRPLGWTTNIGTFSRTSDGGMFGNAEYINTSTARPYMDYVIDSDTFELMKGKKVIFSGYVKSTINGARILMLGTTVNNTSGSTDVVDEYQLLSISAYVPESDTTLKIRVYGVDGGSTVSLSMPMLTIGDYQTSLAPDIGGKKITMYDQFNLNRFIDFIDGDGTPSVKDGNNFTFDYAAAKSITNFDDYTNGQVINLHNIGTGTAIITQGTQIKLSGSVSWGMVAGDTLTLVRHNSYWVELSRMVA